MQDTADKTSDYIDNFISDIVGALPEILGALLILLIGYIVAKVVSSIVRKALTKVGLNQYLQSATGGNIIQRAIPNLSGTVASIVFWALFLFAISVSVSALGIPALVDIVEGIYAYLPNVLAAFIIFLVAGAISGVVATLAANAMGDTPTGKIVASAAPVVVMGLATFMILNQLKIAPEIVTITYAGLVGTAVLAFGLGGKDAASRMFMDLYEAGQRNKGRAVSDFKKGGRTAQVKARDIQEKL
jgi:hypothetical protein